MPGRLTVRRAESAPDDRPGDRSGSSPLAAVLVCAGLAGMVVGASLRPGPVEVVPPPVSSVLATVEVTGVASDVTPVALVEVTVHNGGADAVELLGLAVTELSGPALESAEGRGRHVEPGSALLLPYRLPLPCLVTPGATGFVEASVTVRAVPSPGGEPGPPQTISAVGIGPDAQTPVCTGGTLPR